MPFANTNGVQYGTMAHWDDLLPTPPDSSTWPPPYFFVSHDFVMATANGNPAAAVYHECMPCWSLFNGALFGCLARNPECLPDGLRRRGTDFDRFTQVYALRVGTGLQPAASSKPLMEARTFNAPTQTRVPRPIIAWSWMQSRNGTPSAQPAVPRWRASRKAAAYITAAKVRSGAPPEDLILRIYTPTPQQSIQVTLGGSPRCRRFHDEDPDGRRSHGTRTAGHAGDPITDRGGSRVHVHTHALSHDGRRDLRVHGRLRRALVCVSNVAVIESEVEATGKARDDYQQRHRPDDRVQRPGSVRQFQRRRNDQREQLRGVPAARRGAVQVTWVTPSIILVSVPSPAIVTFWRCGTQTNGGFSE